MFDRLCVYRRTCQPNKENELRLKGELKTLTPKISLDLISNSPHCLPNDSHYVSLENLVSDQQIIIP